MTVTVPTRTRAARTRAARTRGTERGIVSPHDQRRGMGVVLFIIGLVAVVGLTADSVGPVFWLFKSATSTTTEVLAQPLALWPTGLQWDNFVEAFSRIEFGRYLLNTLWVCLGAWVGSVLVSTTGGYVLAVIRPWFAPILQAAVLATLLIPGVISLVGLYLTVVDLPIFGVNLINTYWAVWLPASASALGVILAQRFFAGLPREIFEAAEVDGAGSVRVFVSIVLPMSRPILGVLSLLAIVDAYKDFLWPLLVLPRDDVQPLSVALPRLESATELSVFLAALFVSAIIPIGVFLLLQRQFLSAAGSSGALKG